MKSMVSKIAVGLVSLGWLAGISTAAIAADAVTIPAKKPHNMVVQVTEDNEKSWNLAMNNAVNVQKELGIDNINIEVVTYGPGLKMLVKDSAVANRVKDLSLQNITFSACGNTMKKMEKDTGKPVELTEGSRVVPAGIVRIIDLQEAGWSYIRP